MVNQATLWLSVDIVRFVSKSLKEPLFVLSFQIYEPFHIHRWDKVSNSKVSSWKNLADYIILRIIAVIQSSQICQPSLGRTKKATMEINLHAHITPLLTCHRIPFRCLLDDIFQWNLECVNSICRPANPRKCRMPIPSACSLCRYACLCSENEACSCLCKSKKFVNSKLNIL